MKPLFSLSVLLVLSFSALATEQVPDIFIYNNKLIITDTPPEISGRYLPVEVGNKIRSGQKGYSTGCYRGYIATWRLRNDSLFLVKLERFPHGTLQLSDYFPNQCSENGVFAQWFNSVIGAGTEDMMNYNVPFKEALRFTGRFKNGILQKEKQFISPLIKTDFAGKWLLEKIRYSFSFSHARRSTYQEFGYYPEKNNLSLMTTNAQLDR